jgi:hypothetical protein
MNDETKADQQSRCFGRLVRWRMGALRRAVASVALQILAVLRGATAILLILWNEIVAVVALFPAALAFGTSVGASAVPSTHRPSTRLGRSSARSRLIFCRRGNVCSTESLPACACKCEKKQHGLRRKTDHERENLMRRTFIAALILLFLAATAYAVGEPAVDFTLKDLSGKSLRLADQKGRSCC